MSRCDTLRPVGERGNLEKISTARHNLGFYRSVAVTATYVCSELLGDLECVIWAALQEVVLRHPVLCCGIVDEDTRSPTFIRLAAIDLRRNVLFKSSEAGDGKEFSNCLEGEHSKLWPDLQFRPGWRLILMKPQGSRDGERAPTDQSGKRLEIDVLFVWHHALCDGLSGAAFHHSLLKELRRISCQSPPANQSPVIQIPCSVQLSPPIEKLMEFPTTWAFIGRQLWGIFAPLWLCGRPATINPEWIDTENSLPSIDDYKSRVRLISVPAEGLECLRVECRKATVTLTALLQGVIGVSLMELDAIGFTGHVPYSMRRFTGTPMSEMVDQVSEMCVNYDSPLIANLTRNPRDAERIWETARHFQDVMKGEMARAPVDNPLSMLPYLSDYHNFFRKRLGKPNGTFEVSNLGEFKNAEGQAARKGQWGIERMIFSQSAMAVGPALGFNCISVENGPLMISLTWLDGIIEDQQLESLASKVEMKLKTLSLTKS
ncbi:hypothetical protein FGG08_004625 [Glutinoglossum americanum]|uniref:Alcohol acetyltransferase n=1 Tax=Glutinoglossum americanum TaxID=1670608 RepID=A0A9P8I740_9PEZI|nr:hypothetical protein FGG08_004625 [Glutinoglossum americanum]